MLKKINLLNNDTIGLWSGADSGFFLGGGAPLRDDVTDGDLKNFKSEYIYKAYTKTKASSRGGGVHIPCTLSLDPPLLITPNFRNLSLILSKVGMLARSQLVQK